MNKEYRKRLFALMDEIDDLAKMGIHLEKEEVTGEVEMLQEPEKAQPKIEVKKSKIDDIPEEPTGPNHDTTRRYSANFKKFIVNMHKIHGMTFDEITQRYGVAKATVTKWCTDARYVDRDQSGGDEVQNRGIGERERKAERRKCEITENDCSCIRTWIGG